MPKVLILFDSDTQHNEYLAKHSEAILEKLGTENRLKRVAAVGTNDKNKEQYYDSQIDIVSEEDLLWADAYVFSFPIHTGSFSASMKYTIDQFHNLAAKGVFLNKPATAMTIGKISHAGAETAIQQLYTLLMQWGSLIVSTSIANSNLMQDNGNPYGLSFILDSKNSFGDEKQLNQILNAHFERFSKIAGAIKVIPTEINNKVKSPYNIVDSLG